MKQVFAACVLFAAVSQVTEARRPGGKFRALVKNKLKQNAGKKLEFFCENADLDSELGLLCECADLVKTHRKNWSDEQKETARSCKDKVLMQALDSFKTKIESVKERFQEKRESEGENGDFSTSGEFQFIEKLAEARREKMVEMCENVDETDDVAVFKCGCLEIREIDAEDRSEEEASVFEQCKQKMAGKRENLKEKRENLKEKFQQKRQKNRKSD